MSSTASSPSRYETILGIRFFIGTAQDAIDEISREGGLVALPAAPALKNLARDNQYRDALLGADFAIADSALMVLLWNVMQHARISKLSGLKYLRALIEQADLRQSENSFWVMPSPEAALRNATWLRGKSVPVVDDSIYIAPIYGAVIRDLELLERLELRRPRHIVLGIGGGTQEARVLSQAEPKLSAGDSLRARRSRFSLEIRSASPYGLTRWALAGCGAASRS